MIAHGRGITNNIILTIQRLKTARKIASDDAKFITINIIIFDW